MMVVVTRKAYGGCAALSLYMRISLAINVLNKIKLKYNSIMKKSLLLLLMSVCSSLYAFSAVGDTFTVQTIEGHEMVFTILDEDLKTCQVGYINENSPYNLAVDEESVEGSLTIPNTANGYTVIKIGSHALQGVDKMTSVTIPNTVTAFDECAFQGCNGLTFFELPANVTTICESALSGLTNVTSISVAEGNTKYDSRNNCNAIIEKATNKLLFGCKNTTIPASVIEIGCFAFLFNNLRLTIPSTINTIDGYAFIGQNMTLQVERTTPLQINDNVFQLLSYSTLRVPAGCKDAYEAAVGWSSFTTIFEGNEGSTFTAQTSEGLDMVFTILDETEKTCQVGYYYSDVTWGEPAIDRDGVNTSVTIPETVKGYTVVKIGKYAFDNISRITSVTIPNTVTAIDNYAFHYCVGLTSIELPARTIVIGACALEGLSNITSIKVAEGNTKYDSRNNCNAIIEKATNKLILGCKNTTIPASVTEIGSGAFLNLSHYSLSIPSSITIIDGNAFSGSDLILQVERTTPLQINDNVFQLLSYSTLRVPAGCKTIYASATGWNKFSTILEGNEGSTFTAMTTEGYNMVFTILDEGEKTCQVGYLDGAWDKTAVDKEIVNGTLTIPETVEGYTVAKIGRSAFQYVNRMTYVTIPNTVTAIDENAFNSCDGLTSFELPASVTTIGESALSGLTNVTSISVAEGNTKYDSRNNCNAIIEIATNKLLFGCKNTTIPASVTEIGSWAFSSLHNYTFTIPPTITKIDDYAFFWANNLTLQVEHTTPLQINEIVFQSLSNSTLRVPLGCKAAYAAATGWKNFGTIQEDITFKAKTTENIDVVFTVLDETAKTCCLGYIDGSSDKTAVTNGSSLTGTLTIPSSVTPPGGSDSYTVKEIGKYAFYGCSSLSSIVIPNSIEVIDNYALAGCEELTSINLPAQLTTIGDKAFMDCKTIGSINIPASVSSIGKGILSGCIGLSSITVANGNTRYYSGMDNDVIICEAYTVIAGCKNTVIPSSITKIDDYAFENLEDVSIVIPNTVTEIGVSSFAGLSGSVVTLPSFAVTIGDHAFADGENSMIISSYQTPITTVHADAFVNSSASPNPKKLQVPAGTKDAYLAATGWSVFGSDNIIEEQTGVITKNVATAGTLSDMISAAEKYSITELKLTGELNGTDFRLIREMAGNDYQGNPTGGKLKILDLSEANIVAGGEYYINTDKVTSSTGTITLRGGDFFHFGTQNNVLGNSLFAGCDKLEKVILPESLTSIGEYVFWYCLNLKSFEVPTNVTSIGEDFIFGPHKITEISVKAGNTVFSMVGNKKGLMLGTKLLLGCSDTEIPASTTIIGANAFAYCEGLTTVTLPASVTTIERDAFLSSGLTSITLSSALTTIGSSAFSGCSGLTSLTIPKSVTSFSPIALMNCFGLTELIVEDGNTVYDSRDNCNAIIEKATNKLICGSVVTVIPTTVNVIGADAFRESLQLSSFTIPDWVTTIGERAFMTSGLETITIPSSVTSIGENAFTGCNRMTTVTAEATTPPSINNVFNTSDRMTLYVPTGSLAEYQDASGWADFNRIEEIPTSTVLTARNFSRKYGKENPVFDYIVEGRAITGTPEITCAATTSSDVGTYDIVISKGSVTNSNVTYVNGTLTIEKAIGDMSAPSGKGEIFYSGTAQELVNPGHTSTGTMEYSLDGTNYGTAIPKGTDAKDYMIYYRVKGDANHNDVAAQSFKVTIRKAPLKITANSYTRKQGEKNPEFGVTYDGFKNNETENVLTKKPTLSCIATEDSEPSTYEILVSDAAAANYDISYVKGTLTIEAAPKPLPEPKGTTFDVDTDDSSTKEVKVTFVVKESDSSGTPTVAISDDKDASGSVAIPEAVTHNGVEYKVTEISEGAFQNNTSLTEVKIPASITSIGANAFAGCKNLQEITINIIVPINLAVVGARGFTRATGDDVFEGVNKETCILYVPAGSVDQYKVAPVWKEFKHILPIKTSTGIQGVVQTDGEPFDVFNLSGQKVKSNATSLEGLPRGIYIVKGKKVIN